MKKLLIILACAVFCMGAMHYVRDGASGSFDGSDWADAYDSLPATLIRTDTYYVADGNYPAYTFDDNSSGSDSIWILKATANEHGTETGWNSSYGDGQAIFYATLSINASYIVIDGKYGNEDNGDSYGIKLIYSTESSNNSLLTSSSGTLSSHVRLSYINFEQSGIDHDPDIKSICMEADNTDHWNIYYCYFHESNSALVVFSNGVASNIFDHNWFCMRHTNGTWHGSALTLNNPGTNNGTVIRYNIFKNIAGTCIIEPKNIGSGDPWSHIYIYGNLFYDTSSYFDASAAICDVASNVGVVSNVLIYNNTFVDIENASVTWNHNGESTNSCMVANNLYYNCNTINFTGTDHDYNAFESTEGESNEQTGITSAIFTNYSGDVFTLAGATSAGYSYDSPYNYDMNGHLRGFDGVWDRGAYEYQSYIRDLKFFKTTRLSDSAVVCSSKIVSGKYYLQRKSDLSLIDSITVSSGNKDTLRYSGLENDSLRYIWISISE